MRAPNNIASTHITRVYRQDPKPAKLRSATLRAEFSCASQTLRALLQITLFMYNIFNERKKNPCFLLTNPIPYETASLQFFTYNPAR